MQYLIIAAAFVGAAALVGAIAFLLRDRSQGKFDEKLELFTGRRSPSRGEGPASSVLSAPLDDTAGRIEELFHRLLDLRLLLEQADAGIRPPVFLAVSAGMGAGGVLAALTARCPLPLVPFAALIMAALPLFWLILRRRRRLKKFQSQLPDALELMGRALRAGHGLPAGMRMVGEEMPAPIGKEFHRVFEEQNLNIPLEDALASLAVRVPNLDLKFFSTAVILQRSTGGDLAEILDKIGHLIRERFKIWGQIQALTGEGRLSGIVLLGLPPFLAAAVYYLNPDYLEPLFTDPMGHKMLGGTIVLQILGAVVIKKIINIKV